MCRGIVGIGSLVRASGLAETKEAREDRRRCRGMLTFLIETYTCLIHIALDPITPLASALITSFPAPSGSFRIYILTFPYDGSTPRHDWLLASSVS